MKLNYEDSVFCALWEKDQGERMLHSRYLARKAWRAALVWYEEKQPCGHENRYIYPPTGHEGTTHYCLACACEK